MINWIKNLFKKKRNPKKTKEKDKELMTPVPWPEPLPPIPPPPKFEPDEPDIDVEEPISEREQFLRDVDNIPIVDIRHLMPDPPPLINGKRKWRVRNGTVVRRRPKNIDKIVFHQTAARFGVSKRQLREADGDKRVALAKRGQSISTPITVFYNDGDPFVAYCYDLDWYSYHGNDFNSTGVGFEIDGDFPGLMNDPNTAYRKKDNPDVLSYLHKCAACRAVRLIVDDGRKMGMPLKYVVAHRQSSPTRRSDPGEQIWKEVVLDYAVRELGLETVPDLIQKKGYSIPKQWDPDGPGDYWDEPLVEERRR